MADRIKLLRQAINTASGELSNLVDDEAGFLAKETEIADLRGQLERAQRVEANNAGLTPAGTQATADELHGEAIQANLRSLSGNRAFTLGDIRAATGFVFDQEKHFRSFGEQLQAIASYYIERGTKTDGRLVRAPVGAGEVDPTGGGFLVQSDFANSVFVRAYQLGKILGRVAKFPISTNANSLKIPAVDEVSRATGSRYGGVQSYWLAEGDTITGSKPKFRMVEFDLKKLGSLMYVTDELLADSTLLGQIANVAFSEELVFMTEDAIFEGDGAGKPLGFLAAPGTVQVAKEVGQASGTIVKENIDKMYAALWGRSRTSAVWNINQLCWPQIFALNQAVGTGGMPMYIPPGAIGNNPKPMLYGIPIEEIEYCAAPGTPGDIVLADYSQYGVADKGGVQAASSMHVRFVTDEMTFRFTYRVDGKPMWNQPLTPFKGATKLSPFITLAQR